VDLTSPVPPPLSPRRPVDIDLTSPDPTRRPVDVDLTVERPWEDVDDPSSAYLLPTGELDQMLRPGQSAGSPDRRPTSAAHRSRQNRWTSRKYRRVSRRLRPRRPIRIERHLAVLAVMVGLMVVLCTAAVGVRAKLADEAEFVTVSAPLHKDPAVADQLSRTIANNLVASGAVDAPRALDVKLMIEDTIASDSFEPTWRRALKNLHKMAFLRDRRGMRIGEAAPALAADLEDQQLASARTIRYSRISLVHDAYASELRTLDGLIGRLLRIGVPAMAVVTFFVLRRTRNRYRAAGLIAGTALLGALAALALGESLASFAVDLMIHPQLRPLAEGAFAGVLPSVQVLLIGLAIVSATLLVASRLEEVRLTPFVPASRRRRRSKHRSGSRDSSVSHGPVPAVVPAMGDPGI